MRTEKEIRRAIKEIERLHKGIEEYMSSEAHSTIDTLKWVLKEGKDKPYL